MADRELTVILKLQDQATAALQRTTAGFRSFFSSIRSGVSSSLGGLSSFLSGHFVFTLGDITRILGDVGRLLKQSVDDADAASRGFLALEQGLSKTSEESEKQAKALAELASQMQRVSTFEDDAIIAQQALSASMGLTADQIDLVTRAAVELASTGKTTLEGAFVALTKSFQGVDGPLGRLLPTLKGINPELLKTGAGVEAVLAQFSGQATTQLSTFGGQLTNIGNLWGDVREQIGQIITDSPAGIHFMSQLRDIIADIGSFFGSNGPLTRRQRLELFRQEEVERAKTAHTEVEALAASIERMKTALDKPATGNSVLDAMNDFFATDAATGIADATERMAQLKAREEEAGKAAADLAKQIQSIDDGAPEPGNSPTEKFLEGIHDATRAADDATRDLQARLAELRAGDNEGAVARIKIEFDAEAGIEKLRDQIASAQARALSATFSAEDRNAVIAAARTQIELLHQVRIEEELKLRRDENEQILELQGELNRALLSADEAAIADQVAAIQKQTDAWRELATELGRTDLFGQIDAVQSQLLEDIEETETAAVGLSETFQHVFEESAGQSLAELTGAFDEVIDSTKGAEEAIKDFGVSFLKQMARMIEQALILATIQAAIEAGTDSGATGILGILRKIAGLSAAEGGIVTGPTLVLAGDNRSGREALVPLERAGEFGFGGGGIHSEVNVFMQGGTTATRADNGTTGRSRELAKMIDQQVVAIIQRERRPGGILDGAH